MAKSAIERVSIRSVNKLGPNETITDPDLKGFGVRRRSGGPIDFLHTRVKGRLRWITIGRHGEPWTPTTARKEAKRLLSEIINGTDPAAAKEATRKAPTVREAAERFMAEHGMRLKPRTREEYQRLFKNAILPEFARRQLREVSRADVVSFHTKLAGTPRKANFALSVLSKMMNWAEMKGLRPENSNPCRLVQKYRENKRQRFLAKEEVAKLGSVLDHLEADGSESPYVIAAIRLLLLTGARLSEILTLEWRFVDLQRAIIFLPDSKTGQKPIFLNNAAQDLLINLPRIDGNPYVIVGEVEGGHLINLQKPWRRIRKHVDIDDVRLHDLRHSFASFAAEGGASLQMIGALLGHTQPETTQRYAHLVQDQVQRVNDDVGERISNALAHPSAPTPRHT